MKNLEFIQDMTRKANAKLKQEQRKRFHNAEVDLWIAVKATALQGETFLRYDKYQVHHRELMKSYVREGFLCSVDPIGNLEIKW